MNKYETDFEAFCQRGGHNAEELLRVNSLVQGDAFLGGGAIRRVLMGMPLDSDFDYFFKSKDHFEVWEANLLRNNKGLKKTRETTHHCQYEGVVGDSSIPVVIQAIMFRFYDSTWDVLDSFDYTITQFVLSGSKLYTTTESLWDLGRKKLVLHKVTYPVATMRRMLKYTNQGFTACGGCMQDLFTMTLGNTEALAQMDITYVD